MDGSELKLVEGKTVIGEAVAGRETETKGCVFLMSKETEIYVTMVFITI